MSLPSFALKDIDAFDVSIRFVVTSTATGIVNVSLVTIVSVSTFPVLSNNWITFLPSGNCSKLNSTVLLLSFISACVVYLAIVSTFTVVALVFNFPSPSSSL